MERWNVGILLFPDVEVLDFAGPFEVFSRTRLEPGTLSRRSEASAPFRVFTIARTSDPVVATGGLRVIPDHGFGTEPRIDLLVVPGGIGTRALLEDETQLAWVREAAGAARLVSTVCTGSLLLAKLGLLGGRRATTHWSALDLLEDLDPTIEVQHDARVVEDGIVTSAGVSAGIDMALRVVERLHGESVAADTARYMDYPWPGGRAA